MKKTGTIWKALFKQTVVSYFKYIVLFILNLFLLFVACVILDVLILLSDNIKLWQVVVLAIINVGLLLSTYFSFVQIHRYLVSKTVSDASNILVVQYVYPVIDRTIAKIGISFSQNESESNEVLIRQRFLQIVKKENVGRGLKIIQNLIFRKINLKGISWKGGSENVVQVLKNRTKLTIGSLLLSSKKYLYLMFALGWIFILILALFRWFVH